jgi:hypothetical protein
LKGEKMLFFVFIAILVASLVIFDKAVDSDLIAGSCAVLAVLAIVAVIGSLVIMGVNYINVDGYVDRMNVRYDTLVYQYENDIYDNDNDLGKRELMKDIQSWNESLAANRERQDDFWIGIYTPNIYDQFEFIQLEKE